MSNTADFLNSFAQTGSQYSSIYNLAQQTYGVPASVLAAQDYAESTFGTATGNGGGIAQFEPGTINGLGSSISAVQNPSVGILEQAKYMSQLIAQNGGNISAALSAYNTGSANSTTGQQYAAGILSNANALGNQAAVSGQLSASQTVDMIPGQSASTIQGAAQSAQKQGCPSLSLSPSSWVSWAECEGYNILLMLLGTIGVVIAFGAMFKVSPSDLAGVAAMAA